MGGSSEWQIRTLGECATWYSGGTPRKSISKYWNGDIPWISAKSLVDFYISDSEDKVTEEGARNGTRLVPKNTVLFIVRGMSLKKEFRLGLTTRPVTFNQDLKALVPNSDVDAVYLAYAIRAKTEDILQLVGEAGHGTGVLPTDRIQSLEIGIPPIADQKRIGRSIQVFDYKIDLNRRINQTLEAMAQAIFKSWFVDFEPVRAKIAALEEGEDPLRAAMCAISGKTDAELEGMSSEDFEQLAATAALFPDGMEDSELGEIPRGWECLKVETVLKRLPVKKRYTKKQVSKTGVIPVFEQGASIVLGYHDGQASYQVCSCEPMFIFGDHTCITRLSCQPFDVSQNVIPVIGKDRATIWVYYAVKEKQEFQEYRRHWMELVSKDVVVAPPDVCFEFSQRITSLHLKIEECERQVQNLSELRDVLLPKLLSGEVVF